MKTQMKIQGNLLSPLAIGSSAFIREGMDTRRTSTVKAIYAQSKSAVVFETQNTVYFLTFPKNTITTKGKELAQ